MFLHVRKIFEHVRFGHLREVVIPAAPAGRRVVPAAQLHAVAPDSGVFPQQRPGVGTGQQEQLFRPERLARQQAGAVAARNGVEAGRRCFAELDLEPADPVGGRDEAGQQRVALVRQQDGHILRGEAIRLRRLETLRNRNRKRQVIGVAAEIRLAPADCSAGAGHGPPFAVDAQAGTRDGERIPLRQPRPAEKIDFDRRTGFVGEFRLQEKPAVVRRYAGPEADAAVFRLEPVRPAAAPVFRFNFSPVESGCEPEFGNQRNAAAVFDPEPVFFRRYSHARPRCFILRRNTCGSSDSPRCSGSGSA